jgi:hypothetical protein
MANEIDALDRALKRNNQTITLRRLPAVDIAGIPAVIRGYNASELTSNIAQQDSFVILSPTQINAAVWPGAQVSGQPDIRIPSKNRGDVAIINGVSRTVQAGVGIYVQDVLVRIEMQVR